METKHMNSLSDLQLLQSGGANPGGQMHLYSDITWMCPE
jgi:hypothetical protein